VTVIDGGSTDGAIPYLRNWERVNPKIRMFIHPWKDNFPEQRNNYLRRVGEIAADGDWVLAFDPDEFLAPDALTDLRAIIDQANRLKLRRVCFQCRSVSYRGPERVWENVDNYWKGLLYKWSPNLKYGHTGDGPVHETLNGVGSRDMEMGHTPGTRQYLYEHRKQENVIWPRGLRNLFVGGGGPNLGSKNPFWVELRAIASRLGLETWAQFHAYILKGGIDAELKRWFVDHRHDNWGDGSSEHREGFKTVFRLYHPEEEPEETRGEHIP
jgi:glycosyltransferase involved in cell wall biosynthesis